MARNVAVEGWNRTCHAVFNQLARHSQADSISHFLINPIIGPEAITGSSRMKGGITSNCIDVFWSSDSSLSCTHQPVNSESISDAVTLSMTFLDSNALAISSMSVRNDYFIHKQYPVQDVVAFCIYSLYFVNKFQSIATRRSSPTLP
jgi:hypothetical protein